MKVLIKAGGNVNQATTTDGRTPLYEASQNGHLAIVKALLKAGGNVNQAETTNGCTPILIASLAGHTEVVRLLVQQPNVDLNKVAGGKSALGHAMVNIATGASNDEIYYLLAKAGAK